MNDARMFFCEKLLLQSHTKVHMQKEKNGHGPQLDSINAIAFTSKTQGTHIREKILELILGLSVAGSGRQVSLSLDDEEDSAMCRPRAWSAVENERILSKVSWIVRMVMKTMMKYLIVMSKKKTLKTIGSIIFDGGYLRKVSTNITQLIRLNCDTKMSQ